MKVSRNGIDLTVNENNPQFWHSFDDGSWEKETISILDNNLYSEDVFIDIGAWIGPVSLYSSHKVKKCYSFEPDPIAFKELQKNIFLNTKVATKINLFNKAITSDGKPVKLFSRFSHGDSGSSILKRVRSYNEVFEVASTTFSKFIIDEKITAIDFIKMDIEGGEFFILESIIDFISLRCISRVL